MFRSLFGVVCWLSITAIPCDAADDALRIGFAEIDVTPAIGPGKRTVWIAGYSRARSAKGVHDPLLARVLILRHREEKIAFVSVDLIGLQFDAVRKIREQLPEFKHVTVSSTHNHEGPDVIGIWGASAFQSGVDPAYVTLVVERIVAAVREADGQDVAVNAAFGLATDETLIDDARLPIMKDGTLRAVRFNRLSDGKPAALLVQWSCHPESLGPKNRLLTADFPADTVAALRKKYDCPVLYVTGAVGGLMTHPQGRVRDAAGNALSDGTYEYARAYGELVAALAGQAIDGAEPISLTPFTIVEKHKAIPVDNLLYRAARTIGVVKREGRLWLGDADRLGEVLTETRQGEKVAVATVVGCLRLGSLHIVNIPGELYPELLYEGAKKEADVHADFPDAPCEPTVASIMRDKRWMIFGLANDEIGYILPKRQWDAKRPYCFGLQVGQYGEVNSCGPDTAPIIMQALSECVSTLNAN